MDGDSERARFEAWWLGDDGPYSVRAEHPSSETEAAWMAWQAKGDEIKRLRAALEQVYARINEGHYEAAFAVARAALTAQPAALATDPGPGASVAS